MRDDDGGQLMVFLKISLITCFYLPNILLLVLGSYYQ